MSRTMIHLQGVHKSFGTRHILRGVDLEVQEGETICLIGGSGTGKSVSLKLIMRLLDPDEGKVHLDGEDITHATGDRLGLARTKLGVNFQFGALLKWLTVFENVALPLRENTRMKPPEIEKRVMQKLELLRIPQARDLYPDQISGGMQKRAGLARAVVMEETVKVILYDEPTSGLDPISTAMVDDMVNEMRERLGLTQIIVTHDMASAYRTADRIAVLFEGQIVQFDTPEGIQNSTHPYVVQFVHGLTAAPDEAMAKVAKEQGTSNPAASAAFQRRSSGEMRAYVPSDLEDFSGSEAGSASGSTASSAASGSTASGDYEPGISGSDLSGGDISTEGLAAGSASGDFPSGSEDLQDFAAAAESALESGSGDDLADSGSEGDVFASASGSGSASGDATSGSRAQASDVDPLDVGSEDDLLEDSGSEDDLDGLDSDEGSVHSGAGQVLSLESEEQPPLPPGVPADAGLLPGAAPAQDDEDVFLISSESNRLLLGDTDSMRVPHYGETESGRLVLDEPGSSEETMLESGDDIDELSASASSEETMLESGDDIDELTGSDDELLDSEDGSGAGLADSSAELSAELDSDYDVDSGSGEGPR